MSPTQTVDYVIVGAGSAGCVLANRLSEDPNVTVALLEFGGTDWGPFIQMPAALSYPLNMRRYDWGYRTEPEPHLNGREITCPRGKVIGGSSSINGMVYVRGHPLDFDRWAELGATGWSAAAVLPYFKRLETAPDGDASYRGHAGLMYAIRGQMKNPLYLYPSRSGRRLSRDARLQCEATRRLRRDGTNHLARPSLVGRERLPQTGSEAFQRVS